MEAYEWAMENCVEDYPVTQFTEAIQQSFDAALVSRFENATQTTSRWKWKPPKMKIWRRDWPEAYPRTNKAEYAVSVFRQFIRQVTTVKVEPTYDCYETRQGKYSMSTVHAGCEAENCTEMRNTVWPWEIRQRPWWKCTCKCPDNIANASGSEYVPFEAEVTHQFPAPLTVDNLLAGSKAVVEVTFEVHVSGEGDAAIVAESIRQFERNSTQWGPTVTEEFNSQLVQDYYDQPPELHVRLVKAPVIGDIVSDVNGAAPAAMAPALTFGLVLLVSWAQGVLE
jgi:hypothetical protein